MGRQALEGVKVADFTWAVAGPFATKYLAEHGAQVVKIETGTHLCPLRTTGPYKDNIPGVDRSGHFANYNDNKYGIALNLRHPRAREVARKIVAWADVVWENFGPGMMSRWSLGYDDLRQIKSDIIMVSSCLQGQTGPHAALRGHGTHLSGLSGFFNISGWPGRGPVLPYGPYTDIIAARLTTAVLLAALDYHRRTGEGQYIDLSQYEAALQFLAPLLLDFIVNGRVAEREGNRCSYAAPHGAYPCKGEDKWCVIAVFTDEEWERFCQVIGNLPWTKDTRFNTLLNRKRNEEELDRLVAEWTKNFTAEEIMVTLQSSGIAAGMVHTCEDIGQDPQLKYRHQYWQLKHPVIGEYACDSPGFRLSKTPVELHRPSPCLGEHTEYVCTKILGMPDDKFFELLQAGVFE